MRWLRAKMLPAKSLPHKAVRQQVSCLGFQMQTITYLNSHKDAFCVLASFWVRSFKEAWQDRSPQEHKCPFFAFLELRNSHYFQYFYSIKQPINIEMNGNCNGSCRFLQICTSLHHAKMLGQEIKIFSVIVHSAFRQYIIFILQANWHHKG